uniref:DUF4283 domain-containing protein n=1 Tax=Nelumbo nucifera TaxID=4432 RepID=A0A822Z669_NELNU|nr:TPA_asm: hypothetical protein HUJ06_007669 [Nelumbo nucifera]
MSRVVKDDGSSHISIANQLRPFGKWKDAFVCSKTDDLTWNEVELGISANLHSPELICLHPFSRNKAVGFASSEDLVSIWVMLEKILVYGRWVKIDQWWLTVNAVPSGLSFDGWVLVHSLSFHLWSEEVFSLIGSLCGGLEEIDPKTKDWLELSFARLKVKSRGVHSIPRSIPILDRNVCFFAMIEVERKLSNLPLPPSQLGAMTRELGVLL